MYFIYFTNYFDTFPALLFTTIPFIIHISNLYVCIRIYMCVCAYVLNEFKAYAIVIEALSIHCKIHIYTHVQPHARQALAGPTYICINQFICCVIVSGHRHFVQHHLCLLKLIELNIIYLADGFPGNSFCYLIYVHIFCHRLNYASKLFQLRNIAVYADNYTLKLATFSIYNAHIFVRT